MVSTALILRSLLMAAESEPLLVLAISLEPEECLPDASALLPLLCWWNAVEDTPGAAEFPWGKVSERGRVMGCWLLGLAPMILRRSRLRDSQMKPHDSILLFLPDRTLPIHPQHVQRLVKNH